MVDIDAFQCSLHLNVMVSGFRYTCMSLSGVFYLHKLHTHTHTYTHTHTHTHTPHTHTHTHTHRQHPTTVRRSVSSNNSMATLLERVGQPSARFVRKLTLRLNFPQRAVIVTPLWSSDAKRMCKRRVLGSWLSKRKWYGTQSCRLPMLYVWRLRHVSLVPMQVLSRIGGENLVSTVVHARLPRFFWGTWKLLYTSPVPRPYITESQ